DREILVDGLDARATRVGRRAEVRALSVKEDLPLVGLERARQGLDQGRLAGAVVAADRDDLVRIEVGIGLVQGHHLAEALVQAAGLEERSGAHARLRWVS